MEQFTTTSDTNGNITVAFTNVVDHAQVSRDRGAAGTGGGNPPIPTFTATPVSGSTPLSVTFTGNNTGGTATLWEWDFDNNGTYDYSSSSNTASHTYTTGSTPTAYSVKVRASNAYGSPTSTQTNCITVNPVGSSPVYQINCGGSAASPYSDDAYYTSSLPPRAATP